MQTESHMRTNVNFKMINLKEKNTPSRLIIEESTWQQFKENVDGCLMWVLLSIHLFKTHIGI